MNLDHIVGTRKARTEAETTSLRTGVARMFSVDKFTCDDCPEQPRCPFAFDVYNTEGDCLAEK